MTRAQAGRVAALAVSAIVFHLALTMPDRPPGSMADALLRLSLELPLLVGVLIAVAGSPRLAGAVRVVVTAGLTAVVLLKAADLALYEAFSRPFNPVTDTFVFAAGLNVLAGTLGTAAAIGAIVAAVTAVALTVWVLAWAAGRWTGLTPRRWQRGIAASVAAAFAILTAADAGQPLGWWALPVDPPGEATTTVLAIRHAGQARAAAVDLAAYRAAAADDPYRDAAGLFGGLHGRDVIVVFIESYGRTSFANPLYATTHLPMLAGEDDVLADAGLAARSLWLTSPVAGGQSWLAHGTFASGLKTGDQARYGAMLASPRRTLFHLARDAGYRTAAVMPAITLPWPEGPLLGFDTILAAADMGYRGAPFNWVTMPDQYTLAAWPRLLGDEPRPDFVQVALISSHAPWVPIPPMIDWDAVGDGRIYDQWANAGDPPAVVWRDMDRVRDQYRIAIDYALRAAFGFAGRRAGPDAPLVIVLGDHQPAPAIAQVEGQDVPVHIVGPPDVVALFDGWGMTDGLIPGMDAPVWPMEAFRDRFIGAVSAVDVAADGL